MAEPRVVARHQPTDRALPPAMAVRTCGGRKTIRGVLGSILGGSRRP